MKKYQFYRTYEQSYGCLVEADSLEEAQKKAEQEEWYDEEGGEPWLILEKWRCIESDEELDEDEVFDRLEEENWNVIYELK
jgi:hypothetical protein